MPSAPSSPASSTTSAAESWGEILARQDRVITRRQALRSGLSLSAWKWRLSSGRWQSPLDGVAVAHTGTITFEQQTWAALLRAGKGAWLSGDVALSLAGLRFGTPLDTVALVLPHTRRVDPIAFASGPTVKITRTRGLDGLPKWESHPRRLATHVAVLHAAEWAATDREAEWRLAAAVQKRITTPALIREQLALVPRLTRRALIVAVLDDVELGAHAGSELLYLRFCREHDLPLPDALQVRVRQGSHTHYLDARYVRQRITVELDGAHHAQAGQYAADALRSLRVMAALPGEQVVRLTPSNLRHDGIEVAELLRVVLA